MKKTILLSVALLVASFSFAQKKELREISKSLKSGSYAVAKDQINDLESSISSADEGTQAEFYLYKGQAYGNIPIFDVENIKTAAAAYKKVIDLEKSGKAKHTPEAQTGLQELRVKLVTEANNDLQKEKFLEGSKKLYISYTLSPKDTSDLYYAAGYALNGEHYDVAVDYYNTLLDMGYTGIKKEYTAINKQTEEIEGWNTKQDRDFMVMSGEYIKPGERITESQRPEILRNLSLVYVIKGENEKALTIIDEARKANPDDIDLLRVDADLAMKMEDFDKYDKLVRELLTKDPNNPDLYLLLGNSAAEMDNYEEAIKYYKKSIEIDPEYFNGVINLALTIVKDEDKIIEEMNNLGMTPADNKKYDELKKKRENLYREALPYFEKAQQLRPNDRSLVETLMNIYSQIGEDAKFQTMKTKLESME